jgi:hypothetical protein
MSTKTYLLGWEEQDGRGNVLASGSEQVPYERLDGHQVVAALNAVLGIWTLADAANVAGVEPEHLIAEAEAWAAASNNV